MLSSKLRSEILFPLKNPSTFHVALFSCTLGYPFLSIRWQAGRATLGMVRGFSIPKGPKAPCLRVLLPRSSRTADLSLYSSHSQALDPEPGKADSPGASVLW